MELQLLLYWTISLQIDKTGGRQEKEEAFPVASRMNSKKHHGPLTISSFKGAQAIAFYFNDETVFIRTLDIIVHHRLALIPVINGCGYEK